MFALTKCASQVKAAFKQLLQPSSFDNLPPAHQQDVLESEQNFVLWAVNLGVFDHGHASLDYRLEYVPEAVELVEDLLTDLRVQLEALQQLVDKGSIDVVATLPGQLSGSTTSPQVFQGDSDGHDTSSDEDDIDEATARILSTKDIIHRLFRLARSIRNHTTRSAQGRRNIYSVFPSDVQNHIVDRLVGIERLRMDDFFIHLRKQDQDGFVDSEEQVALSDDDTALIERLARASSRRRQQFVYWRFRHERSMQAALGSNEDLLEEQAGPHNPAPQVHVTIPADRALRPESIPSSVTKVRSGQIDLSERRSMASDISRSPSARGPQGERAAWPSVPDGSLVGTSFECPFCYNWCPQRYRTDAGWKAHLVHDLKPYCCTYPACDTGDQLYDSWADWTTHEMLVHNKVWTCLEHSGEEYANFEEYRSHIHSVHSTEADSMLTPEIVSARATGSNSSGRPCPFCLAAIPDAGDLQHHIAWHLESVALISLPRSTGHETGSEEDDLRSDVQKADDVDSRVGELDNISLPNEDYATTPDAGQETEATTPDAGQEMEADVGATHAAEESSTSRPTATQNDDRTLSHACREMLLNVAEYLIAEWQPKHSIVISPYKMQQFYKEFGVPEDPYPWQDIFDDRVSSISRLYRTFSIEHHLILEVQQPLTQRPDLPSVTTRGFVDWMELVYRVHPLTEAKRLGNIQTDILYHQRVFSHAGSEMRLQAKMLLRDLIPLGRVPDEDLRASFHSELMVQCQVQVTRKGDGMTSLS